ncbi:MAG: class I SAM-dependent methyltransferase [Bacteroidota bacterium]
MKKSKHNVSKTLAEHYQNRFQQYGATPQGIHWRNQEDLSIRYERMLNVMDSLYAIQKPTLLDVGCGYGGLLTHMQKRKIYIAYTGVDIVPELIEEAKNNHPKHDFHIQDLADMDYQEAFDYVVCNGIFTLKNKINLIEMNQFVREGIKKLFKACRVGIAFNIASPHVKDFMENNFYIHPLEMLAWCLSELSVHVKIDHAYRLFEYTVYIYKSHQVLEKHGIAYQGRKYN